MRGPLAAARTAPMRWLLLRGLTREQRHWLTFPQTFAQRVGGTDVGPTQVLTLDLPGFGTERDVEVPPTVEGFVEHLRTRLAQHIAPGERIGIVAVSLGGIVALTWLARYPADFVCGAVINASVSDLSPPWHRMRPHNWPRVVAAPFMDVLSRERMLLGMTRHQGDLEADARQHVEIARSAPPSRRAFLGQLQAALRARSPAALTVPTLVMASVGDELVSWRCSERIARHLGLPLALHEGEGERAAGHDLALDDPTWVCERINGLVSSLSTAPKDRS